MKLYGWILLLLFFVAVLAVIATHLVIYQKTTQFQEWSYWLLIADGVLVVLLFAAVGGLVARQVALWRRGARGARLSLRLTFLFWGISLLPAVLLYGVSVSAVFRGIESWFDIPLGSSFERGIAFGQDVIDNEFKRLDAVARDIAGSGAAQSESFSFYIDNTRFLYNLDGIAVYDADGTLLIFSGEIGTGGQLPPTQVERVFGEGRHWNLYTEGIDRVAEVAVPVDKGRSREILWIVRALPAEISQGLSEIERGQQQYAQLLVLRNGLKWSYILTMTLSLVLILFALGWISLWLGRQTTRPLVQLSAAAEAVGSGDFDRRLQETHPLQEISHLNHSFNLMAIGLQESREEIAQRQAALRKTNAYLENLLSSLSTGVLTFSADGKFSGYNNTAAHYCKVDLEAYVGQVSLPPSALTTALEDAAAQLREGSADERVERRVGMPDGEVLLVRASALPEAAGGGILMIIDDISRQLRAEREATWEEASRRFVHEIKNPLTPIQLAAERLGTKLSGKISAEDDAMLQRLVEHIVTQVGAMRQMVDSFRDYADKRSAPAAEPLQLNDLVREVLFFYEHRQIRLRMELPPALPLISGNAITLRQLMHNVLGNAVDALAEQADARIDITTGTAGNLVVLTIEDNGGGVSPETLKKLCEPYVSSKPHGTGLGLAVVRKIVDEHGGTLEVENGAAGLRVTVHLPKY